MSKALIIYNKAVGTQAFAAQLVRYKYPDFDSIEVSALDDTVSTDAIGAAISALTDTYDYCAILCPSSTGGGVATINWNSISLIRAKMNTASQGTLLAAGTSPAGGTSSTTKMVLETGDAKADNYYVGNILVITAGTHSGTIAYIKASDLSDKDVTVNLAVVGAFDATDVYEIYDISDTIVQLNGGEGATLATLAARTAAASTVANTWDDIYPTITRPRAVQILSCQDWALTYGLLKTASSTTSVILADTGYSKSVYTTAKADNFYNGLTFCAVASIGLGQVRTITDYVNSTNAVSFTALTLALGTGATIYQIVKKAEEAFGDIALAAYAATYMRNLTDSDAYNTIKKLIDTSGTLNERADGVTGQDLDYMAEVIKLGTAAFQYTNLASL